MSNVCKQCEAALRDRDAFCPKCGARRESATEASAGRRFCTRCGAALPVETTFCTKCGAPAAGGTTEIALSGASVSGPSTKTAAAASSSTTSMPETQDSASRVVIPRPARRNPKIALVGGTVIILALIVAVAGLISAARRARQKAREREAAEKFERELAKFSSAANSSAQHEDQQTPAEIKKSLGDFAAAASKLTQDVRKEGGASPLNTTTEAASVSSSSTSRVPSAVDSAASKAASREADRAAVSTASRSAPMVPVAATGNQARDWALEYERTVGGPEADLVARTGDINNLGFGWAKGFDPFSGESSPSHPWPSPNRIPPQAPEGTDRIIVGSGVFPGLIAHLGENDLAAGLIADRIVLGSPTNVASDGYAGGLKDGCASIHYVFGPTKDPDQIRADDRARMQFVANCIDTRKLTIPTPIALLVGDLPPKIDSVLVQVFADDFQPRAIGSHFQVSLNGTRIPSFEYALNSLDQSGPVGKLLTLRLLPEYWPLLKSGTVKLLIDDPTTHIFDGYAVDFVRILVNPHNFRYQVSLTATVTDADTHKPIIGATVSAGLASAATDQAGKCELKGIPAGLIVATANAPRYDENSVPVDLPTGQTGNADIELHRHQESMAALEQSIAQTGTATIYGIHFDTGSSKLRSDSLPALQAVLALIKARAGSSWIISGHTDNQGSDTLNIPLSKERAASVTTWLTAHGVAADRLEPQGFGATRPVADNASANGRFLNRRVEIALAK